MLKFTDEKIEEYNKQGKTESVARYKKAKEEVILEDNLMGIQYK